MSAELQPPTQTASYRHLGNFYVGPDNPFVREKFRRFCVVCANVKSTTNGQYFFCTADKCRAVYSGVMGSISRPFHDDFIGFLGTSIDTTRLVITPTEESERISDVLVGLNLIGVHEDLRARLKRATETANITAARIGNKTYLELVELHHPGIGTHLGAIQSVIRLGNLEMEDPDDLFKPRNGVCEATEHELRELADAAERAESLDLFQIAFKHALCVYNGNSSTLPQEERDAAIEAVLTATRDALLTALGRDDADRPANQA